MGTFYQRHDIVANPSDPTFDDNYTIYYGPIQSKLMSLTNQCIARYVFLYTNNVFQFAHRSKSVRHYNNSSVVDVNFLNTQNNAYVESTYDNSGGKKNNIPMYPNDNGPIIELVNILINDILPKLILSPKNGEFYFLEGLVRKWIIKLDLYNTSVLTPGNPKHTFVYKIYRYGVCDVTDTGLRKEQFTYKIVKTINRNQIGDNDLKSV